MAVLGVGRAFDFGGRYQLGKVGLLAYLNAIAGEDKADAATLGAKRVKDYTQGLDSYSLKGVRIGVMTKQLGNRDDLKAIFNTAVADLKRAGAEIVEIDFDPNNQMYGDSFTVLMFELREKLGATYGAGASSDMSDIYTGRGTFSVGTNGDPKDIDAIEKAVESVIAEITAAPVDADLFERGRKPSLESYADWRRQNSTWMQIVDQAQTEPERLERFRRNEERFRSITAQDVWEAAKRFLADKPSYIFRAMPEAKATAPAG